MHEKLFAMFDEVLQGSVPADLRAKGWRYHDFNGKFAPHVWDCLLKILGEGEYQIIIQSQGVDPEKGPWTRGQLFISPVAQANLTDRERIEKFIKEGQGRGEN